MMHEMKLQDRFFNYMKNGTKRIELRLNDEKRQKIQLNDEIFFSNYSGEKLSAKVIGLLRYNNFSDFFRDFPIEILADKSMSKDELRNALEEFYTPEKQATFGVLGIRLEIK